jgi:hypothetical protein
MKSKHTLGPWIAAKTLGQGLVISENTGDNVAVTYDSKDRNIVAAAPDMYEALQEIASLLEEHPEVTQGNSKVHYCFYKAINAINKAKGL